MSKNKENVPKIRFPGFTKAWEQRRLGEVAQYFNGGSFENDVQEKGKYELITLKSVDMNGNLVSSGRYVNIETPTLVKGTLVMILSEQSPGLLGMTAQIPMNNKYVLNQRVAEIRPNQGIDSYFLSLIINKNQQYFSKHGAGTKVQNISKPNVENYKFSCPEFHEQQKIGTFFQQLDDLITLHQRKLNNVQNLKAGLLQKMFPKNGEDFPEVRFPEFTNAWEQRKLGEYCEMYNGDRGINYPNERDIVSDGIPFINAGDLKNGRVNLSDANKITREKYTQLRGAKLQHGDIVYCLRGTLGKNAFIDNFNEGTIASSLVALRPKNIDGKYLFHILNSDIEFRQRTICDEGAAQPNLSAKNLGGFYIPIPETEEQQKIGTFFTNLDNLITLHQRKLEHLQEQKKALLQQMFV
jgi:type I restriction enzyme S subunit